MKKNNTIKAIAITFLGVSIITYSLTQKSNEQTTNNTTSSIEEIVKETNFKLDFKNINELEYTMQDNMIDTHNNTNKTFEQNNKFNISTLESGKISSINYTSLISEMNNGDIDYLQKIYNFVFENISSYMFDKSNELIQKMQSNEYITTHKSNLKNNGYLKEHISLNKTSEIQLTMYYKSSNNSFSPYKICLDILQGNKW